VRARSGDCCEFPGCPNKVFLQKAHNVPHAEGGSREADNIRDLCTVHHVLLDAGAIVEIATDAEGRPIFAAGGRVFFHGGHPGGVPRETWHGNGRPECNGDAPRKKPPAEPPSAGLDGASFVSEGARVAISTRARPRRRSRLVE